MCGKSRNRVLSTSSFHFLFIAIAIRINDGMAFETIAYSFKQNRLMLLTGNVHRPAHGVAYSQHIIAIYTLAEHIESTPFAVEFRHGRTFLCRHAHTILVIHNEKDYRKPINFRQIERLEERAPIGRSITHLADNDFIRTPISNGKGSTCRYRNLSSDNRIATKEATLQAKQVHGTSTPTRTAS